ncbi:hypothetical protein BgiBS90_026654 [Biomphalaria glabrata]|nr:hypothetical protein BgiBS90_026654 [Biomphalaria glabrata]
MVMTRSSIKRAKTIWELRVAIHHVTFKQPRDDGKAQGIDVCGSARSLISWEESGIDIRARLYRRWGTDGGLNMHQRYPFKFA